MTDQSRPSDEQLSAFIDGELSPAAYADVARAMVDDPSLTLRMAELSTLRASVADLDMDHLYSIKSVVGRAPHQAETPTPARWMSSPPMMFVLGAVTSVVIGIGVCVLTWPDARSSEQAAVSWQAAALDIHRHWSKRATQQIKDDKIEPKPILRSLGLDLTSIDHMQIGGVHAVRFGYGSDHGCKVSVFVMNAKALPMPQPGIAKSGGVQSIEWTARDKRIMMVAAGMNREWFERIATALRSWSDQPYRFNVANNKPPPRPLPDCFT